MHSPFLQFFYLFIIGASAALVIAAIGAYLYFQIKSSSITDYKEKYDFINTGKIRNLRLVWLLIAIAGGLLVNLYGMNDRVLGSVGVWFFVRMFFGIAAGTIIGYVSFLLVQFYYPTILNRELNKWRYMARINLATGNKMRLLSEEQEDVHLDEGMRTEENMFSIDYDVWVDEQTNEVRIEKYPGHLQALRCNNCTFHTMKVEREEVVERNDDGSPRELVKHYRCSYCKKVRATQFHVSNREAEDYRQMKMKFNTNTQGIEAIRLEIISALTGRKTMEFPNVEKARKFLEDLEQGAA
ncbi:MAG: hypothetical protein ACKORJ_06305 [Bacteroidota bacterium]